MLPQMQSRERVVIVGMPRSGTTLLATLLASQPTVHFITDYLAVFTQLAGMHAGGWRHPLDLAQRRHALLATRDTLIRMGHPCLVRVEDFATLDELHVRVMDEFGGAGHTHVGHKLVLRTRELDALLDQTDIHAVLMLRDVRDAASSYWHRTGGGAEDYVEWWRQIVHLTRRRAGDRRLTVLRFEDVVRDPHAGLAPLAERLGLSLRTDDTEPLAFVRGGKPVAQWQENSAFADITRRFDASALDRWKQSPNSKLVRYAQWRCGRELRGLGYGAEAVWPERWMLQSVARTRLEREVRSWSERSLRGLRAWLGSELSPDDTRP